MKRALTLALCMLAAPTVTACHAETRPTEAPRFGSEPLQLEVRTASGRPIDLADYRGAPVLIALIGTYDTASQAAIEPLERYARHHPDVFVVALLAQQGADMLIGPFSDAADATFPIAFDPTSTLLEGRTSIGAVESVPSFVTLDALGVVVVKHNGIASEGQLDILVERARAHAPVQTNGTLPLMGRPH